MTYAEAYRELDRDRENIARWWGTQVDRQAVLLQAARHL